MNVAAIRVAIFARKGGAGKTALTTLLARELVRQQSRVLVVDLDPQAVSVSTAFGIDTNQHLPSTPADLVQGPGSLLFEPCSVVPGMLDVLPNSQEQGAHLEHVLHELWQRVRVATAGGSGARRAVLDVRLAAVDMDYDFVLLDCPSALGEVTSNALEAANLLISPIDMKCRANVLSVTDLLQHVTALKGSPTIWFVGNKWVPRERQCRLALLDAHRLCGDRLLGTMVPECTAISEALSAHRELRVASELSAQAAEAVWRLGKRLLEIRHPEETAAGAVGGAL